MVRRITRSGQELVIRPVRAGDAERLYLFMEGLLPDSRRLFRPHEFTRDDAERAAHEAESERSTRLVVIPADDEGIAAYAYFSESGVMDPRVPLLGIAVADRYQNQGLGRVLMQTLIEEARLQGKTGLQLTVFKENARAIHLYSALGFRAIGDADGGKQHAMRLDFAPHEGAMPIRGVILDVAPLGRAPLSLDTWTTPDWLSYVDFLHTAGANLLVVSVWPEHFYHPDVPATLPHAWRLSVLRQALEHARRLEMRTYVAFPINGVPPAVWQQRVDLRAKEIGYRGVGLCWSRARDEVARFPGFLIDALADCADGFVLRIGGPAFCACSACHSYGRVVRDAIEEYAGRIAGRGTLHLDLTDAEDLTTRVGPTAAAGFLAPLGSEGFALVDARDEITRAQLAERGIPGLLHEARLGAPLEGDALALIPRPRLRQVDRVVAQNSEAIGVLGHRSLPRTQFATDYVLLERLLYPASANHEVLQHLGSRLYPDRSDTFGFARALWALDAWWETGLRGDLIDARDGLDSLPPDRLGMVEPVRDAVRLLHELVRYLDGGERHFDALVARLHAQMADSPAFQAYTVDQVWQARARGVVAAAVADWVAALRNHLAQRG